MQLRHDRALNRSLTCRSGRPGHRIEELYRRAESGDIGINVDQV
jgi:hypothetical protein